LLPRCVRAARSENAISIERQRLRETTSGPDRGDVAAFGRSEHLIARATRAAALRRWSRVSSREACVKTRQSTRSKRTDSGNAGYGDQPMAQPTIVGQENPVKASARPSEEPSSKRASKRPRK